MQIKHQKQQRGVSLIELLLVLVIIAAIIVTGFYRYKQYTQDKDMAILRQNVAMLFNSLDLYYAKLAANTDPDHTPICQPNIGISKRDLQASNLWPDLIDTSLVKNKDSDYNVGSTSIEITTPPPNMPSHCVYNHNLLVMVKMNVNSQTLPWYAQMLGASSEGGGRELMWQKLPSSTIEGMSGNLWILGSELAVFKKTMQTGT